MKKPYPTLLILIFFAMGLAGTNFAAFLRSSGARFMGLDPAAPLPGLVLVSVFLFGVLFIVEWTVLRVAGLPSRHIRWIPVSWAPFLLLYPLGSFMSALTLPAPQDLPLRKMEIAAGTIWVSHLFLLALLTLWLLKRERVARMVRAVTVLALFLFPTLLVTTTWCDITGDEPHYLLMAHSILHDGDLDLANNYSNGDARSFYGRGELEPQGLEHRVEGRRYSHHPLGPVLLILPGYALGGRFGSALVMALLAALTLGATLKVLKDNGTGPDTLLATAAAGLLSSPILLFSGLIFPEIPTALLLVLFLMARQARRDASMGLAAGTLLWFHNRNVLLLIPLVLVYLWNNRSRLDRILRFGTGLALPLALLSIYFHQVYGVWTPLGAHNEPFTSLFRLDRFFTGFFGLLLDQEAGLWFHCFLFAAVPAGMFLLLRTRDPLRHYLVVAVLFYFLSMSFYENLGQTPAARFMVCLTPFLLLLIAPALESTRQRPGWARLLWVLGGAGVAVNGALAAVPWMRYNRLEGENWMLKIAGDILHVPWTKWEPAFHMDPVPIRSYVLAVFWCAIVAGLTYFFLRTTVTKPTAEFRRSGDRHKGTSKNSHLKRRRASNGIF